MCKFIDSYDKKTYTTYSSLLVMRFDMGGDL